jgi:DNA-binding IclR family transcriptional regulator
MRLSDLAAATGLQKSTVHRIVRTLVELGYVAQDPGNSLYRPTLRTWELGMGVIADLPVKRAAAGFLQDLHRSTGETVSLTVLSGDDVLYLDKIFAARPIRFTTRVGSRVPAPFTAGGKAMLAHCPDAAAIAARVAVHHRLDLDALAAELEEARTRGHALSSYSPGVISAGAAVLGQGGQPVAALSVSAPEARLTTAKRNAIIESLLDTAARMADANGRP